MFAFAFRCGRKKSSECLSLYTRVPRLLFARSSVKFTYARAYAGTPTDHTNLKPADELRRLAKKKGLKVTDKEFAKYMDDNDEMSHIRKQFHIPSVGELLEESSLVDGPAKGVDTNKECVYFAGEAIGLQPVGAKQLVDEEMEKWRKRGLYGRGNGKRPWIHLQDTVVKQSGVLIGAKDPSKEVFMMNGLCMNADIGLAAFYRPTAKRHKILVEHEMFPSDFYAVDSHIRLHKRDANFSLMVLKDIQRTEDIVAKINKEGDSIALVYLPGIQHMTGQAFDLKKITKAAHSKGCYVGTNLSHAIGNIELHLNDWGVDFACWCNYKHVCASPGGVSGFYIHQKHAKMIDDAIRLSNTPSIILFKLAGWWTHKRQHSIFYNNPDLRPGKHGLKEISLPVQETVTLISALNIFKQFDMKILRKKSRLLTGYCEMLLDLLPPEPIWKGATPTAILRKITPSDPEQRGCSLVFGFSFLGLGTDVWKEMLKRGIALETVEYVYEEIKISPSPLYNTFGEVLHFYDTLVEVMNELPRFYISS